MEEVGERGADQIGLSEDVGPHVDPAAGSDGGVVADVAVDGGLDLCVAEHQADARAADGDSTGRGAGLGAVPSRRRP